ncbi:16S rRNA pseudouridine(516) synthase RsuA [Providencia alcalifaciens]|uniref:Pseudouridine synthase n=3 Tax=Providencia alcalifaciens TaxID=126385 RepID=A0AAW9VAH2_9GAMM|nr:MULTISPECIES: 16S rRNA pseudouridine(516) synthase RsuA [Providencia]EKT66822.1 16S rRNA pseudouridylate synthase A [Providencia alcalifaciens Dmel2]ATG17066.1 16S rRNA pseudouridine(516) synthase RsuA [Providencia alcalifaciens]EEB44689.1 pseudouridylate synthase [Providencia alcalifaciens DSM 30120]ETT07944.1 16S pseudouridylate 516 synthase [Providencia alcalifaciens F90-2004]EUC95722.1 16S pseudouridylate 516 synthase [Providencia alcalifaciens PAL-2]
MRLDKFLSQQLGISRSLVARELRAGNVTVDDEVVKSGSMQVGLDNEVAYDGNVLVQVTGPRYFMLNKPEGYVCSTDDPTHPTILYFIDEPIAQNLHAAGRLDIDTTGLVLLTDDGQWSHRITSPKHHCEKTYRVQLSEDIADDVTIQFEQGVMLNGEKSPTKPAQLEIISPREVLLTISEGRYHQVKRMFAAVGNHVCGLHRERVGEIHLDEQLEPGEYRPLTEAEIKSITVPRK